MYENDFFFSKKTMKFIVIDLFCIKHMNSQKVANRFKNESIFPSIQYVNLCMLTQLIKIPNLSLKIKLKLKDLFNFICGKILFHYLLFFDFLLFFLDFLDFFFFEAGFLLYLDEDSEDFFILLLDSLDFFEEDLDEDSEDFFILLLDSLDFFEEDPDFEEEEEESTLFESEFSEEHDSEDSQLVDDLLPDSRYKPHICRDKFVKHE